jgi:hypothetical protein
MNKPEIEAQLPADRGLARMGGAESNGSTRLDPDRGSSFAAMESALKRGLAPNPKGLSGISKQPRSQRQFKTLAEAGNPKGKSLRITKVK